MKAYTDLEQSKKLANILPLGSADMIWILSNPDLPMIKAIAYEDSEKSKFYEILPAWSLTALLDVLPSVIKRNGKRMFLTLEKAGAYNLYYKSPDRLDELWEIKEEPIDACVAMIEKIYELKML